MCLREHVVVVRILNFCRCFFFLVILISVYQGGSLLFYPRVKRITYLMYTVLDQILRISSFPRCGHVHEGQLVITSQTTF